VAGGNDRARHQNIDTSAYTVRRYPPELVQYMRGHGRRKVMFGTNYPMITAAKALEGLGVSGSTMTPKPPFWAATRRVYSASTNRAAVCKPIPGFLRFPRKMRKTRK
jgi:hypothetical protein